MPTRLWSNPGNPPRSVARALRLSEWQLGEALHAIKQAAGLGGADRVTLWSDGTVTDDRGEEIGNLHDEL